MLEAFIRFAGKQHLFQRNQRVLAAVSGGIDSVVLAELLHQGGIPFAIAHCNFGLRGSESDGDDIFVESLAQRYGIPHFRKFFETRSYAEENGISIQMAARDLRLAWLEEIREQEGYQVIALGTHRDDEVETLLINLTRGTGLRGITGIPVRNQHVVRPLLFTNREEIAQFAKQESLPWREDSSNALQDYQRNRLRHSVIPVLRELNPDLSDAMARNRENFQSTQQFVDAEIERWRSTALRNENGRSTLELTELLVHPAHLFLLFELLRPFGFNRGHIRQLHSVLEQPGRQFHSTTHTVFTDRHQLLIEEKQSTSASTASWKASASSLEAPVHLTFKTLEREAFELDSDPSVACLDLDKLTFPLLLRPWKNGDSFRPLGMKRGSQKVSDFLINQKVPLADKKRIWVVESAGKIVWIVNHRIDEHVKLDERTKKVYLIRAK